MVDFGWRAFRLMVLDSKEIIQQYYGDKINKSYYLGCSTGMYVGTILFSTLTFTSQAGDRGMLVLLCLVCYCLIYSRKFEGGPGVPRRLRWRCTSYQCVLLHFMELTVP